MNILFIGLGGIGQRHLRRWLEVDPDVRLGAVRTGKHTFEITDALEPDYSVNFVEKYGVEKFTSVSQALEIFEPDGAVVANPTSLHAETARELLKAGVPVLLEKPIAHTFEATKALYQAVTESQAWISVGYVMRFHPGIQHLQRLIDERQPGSLMLGEIVTSSYMPDWHKYEAYNSLYAGRSDLGGGVILTESHELDILCSMFGLPDKVWALGGTFSGLKIDVEDTVAAVLKFAVDGRCFPVNLSMSFTRKPLERRMIFSFQQQSVIWDGVNSTITIHKDDGCSSTSYAAVGRNDMFREQMRAFIAAIRQEAPVINPLKDILAGQMLALALKESLATGNPVQPERFW